MMRAILVTSVAALLAACGEQGPPPALNDMQMQELRTASPGMKEACLEEFRKKGFESADIPREVDACFEMQPPRRWKGLWRNEFEGSQFCPAPAQDCGRRFMSPPSKRGERMEPLVWLSFKAPEPVEADFRRTMPGGLYSVDFIGRRTAVKGYYGHMGTSEHEVVVDRLISIKEIEPPPPKLTKAEMIEHSKRCEAEKTCIPNWSYINSLPD